MRPGLILLVLAGFFPAGCETPVDSETAVYQKYYAEVGEQMIVTTSRVEQRNPRPAATRSLSTADRPKAP